MLHSNKEECYLNVLIMSRYTLIRSYIMGWRECCTTSFCNCCLASNINLVLLRTYVIAKDPHFNHFCIWGNEIFMNQHQVRKLIKIVIKMGQKMKIKLFVYALCKTTVNCRMVTTNSAAFSFYCP